MLAHGCVLLWLLLTACLLATLVAVRLVWRDPRQHDQQAQDPDAARRRIDAFLSEDTGPLELRPVALWRPPMRLRHPSVDQVLALAGEDGAELWRLAGDAPVSYVRIPPARGA